MGCVCGCSFSGLLVLDDMLGICSAVGANGRGCCAEKLRGISPARRAVCGCWLHGGPKLITAMKYANNLFGVFLFGYDYRNYDTEEMGV